MVDKLTTIYIYFFSISNRNFIKKRNGSSQVRKKYTRETPKQKMEKDQENFES